MSTLSQALLKAKGTGTTGKVTSASQVEAISGVLTQHVEGKVTCAIVARLYESLSMSSPTQCKELDFGQAFYLLKTKDFDAASYVWDRLGKGKLAAEPVPVKSIADAKKNAQTTGGSKPVSPAKPAPAVPVAIAPATAGVNVRKVAMGVGAVLVTVAFVIGGVWYVRQVKAA